MRNRCGSLAVVLFGMILALGALRGAAQAANNKWRWNANQLEIVTGDWVSGLHGAGVNFGDAANGHASTTFTFNPTGHVRAWIVDGVVVAIEVDGVVVRASTAPAPLGNPNIDFILMAGQQIEFTTAIHKGNPAITGVGPV